MAYFAVIESRPGGRTSTIYTTEDERSAETVAARWTAHEPRNRYRIRKLEPFEDPPTGNREEKRARAPPGAPLFF